MSAGRFEGLLAPVPGPEPAGASLRWGPVHAEIEDARREEDDDLPRGVWRRDLKHADWERAASLCRDALERKSKDLQAACWLVDAAVRLDGPAAAAEGLRFLGDFCELWWETMHPAHDGEPDSPRFAPLVWLDGALALLLATTPVAIAETESGTVALSWSDHAAASRREGARRAAKKPGKAPAPWSTVGEFDQLADRTPRESLEALLAACGAATEAAQALERRLAALAGETAPSLGRLRAAARDAGALARTALDRRPPAPEPVSHPPPEPVPGPSESLAAEIASMSDAMDRSAQPPAQMQLPTDREAAYRALAAIAEQLRRSEPHSLTPYLIERAVRWGGMGAPEVLADLTKGGRDPEMLKWLIGN